MPFDRLLSRPRFAANHASASAPCNIFTTSGTTSAPKFVLHRQGAIAGHAQQVARTFGFTAPETLSLAILPMCGVFGFNQTLATLAAGKPSVLVESYEIEEIARLITEHKPTTMFGSDDMYQRLLELMPGRWPFRSIKWAGYAAFNASLEDLPERAQPRGLQPGRPLRHERGAGALCAPAAQRARSPQRKQGGGVPVSPLAHVRVRDPETGELLGPGQPGALEMAGPSLMVGYYGNEKATAAAMTADGYVRTGDLGQLDGRGGFTFLSRMGDVLRLSGFLVNPLEIEMHIQKVPAHRGLPDRRRAAARGRARRRLRDAGARRDTRRGRDHRPLQARARQLQGADARLPDRRLPQDALAQRLQDPAHQAARDGGSASDS